MSIGKQTQSNANCRPIIKTHLIEGKVDERIGLLELDLAADERLRATSLLQHLDVERAHGCERDASAPLCIGVVEANAEELRQLVGGPVEWQLLVGVQPRIVALVPSWHACANEQASSAAISGRVWLLVQQRHRQAVDKHVA